MKIQNQPYFNLQQLLADCVKQVQTNFASNPTIKIIDDFVAPIILSGCAKNLQKVLILLLKNATAAPVEKIVLTTKQLLQTDKEVLLEFSIADELKKSLKINGTYVPNNAVLVQAEAMINEMGGKSERINVLASGVGLKFILKYALKREGEIKFVKAEPLLAGRKILVLEDNEVNQKAIVQLLQKEGMAADVAADGKTGIDLFENKGGYDIVIMDLQMPHMNGFEAASYIRKKIRSTVPIIGMSASSFEEEEVECLRNGINHCLIKPFAAEELVHLISTCLLDRQPVISNEFQAIRSAV